MTNLVIFEIYELYELIDDKPIIDEKSNTVYMSRDCYKNDNYKSKEINNE